MLLGIVLAGAEYMASWSAPSQWTDRGTQLSAQHRLRLTPLPIDHRPAAPFRPADRCA